MQKTKLLTMIQLEIMAGCYGKRVFPINSVTILDFSGESYGTGEVVTTF